jgi:membrane-bound lytic murein transglycosylase B
MSRLRLRARALLPLLFAFAVVVPPPAQAGAPAAQYANRPDVHEFIRDMVARHGFVERELKTVFRRTTRQPEILKAIRPPVSPRQRSWQSYRTNFINDRHLAEGLRFIELHGATLARAEAEYGVPQEIIVAIIGIETFYGRNMGKWRVVDALATLAFDYPPRAEYFRSELEAYLLFTREADLDVLEVRGSYAGAIGIPQFMPGSYRRWAVDFDGDGVARLRSSPVDAIGSVANFLRSHGWVPGEPVAFPAGLGTTDPAPFLAAGIKPALTLAEFAAAGVQVRAEPPPKPGARAALIELETPDRATEYRIGLDNFYVITRYNRSSFYASAVQDLSEALRSARSRPAN